MDTNALRLYAISATCLLLAACGAVPTPPIDAETETPEIPKPGRKLLMLPDRVWESENCEARPLPYLRLERSVVAAATINPGNSIIYRFPYIACVPAQPGYILGRLRTTVSFGRKELSTRSDDTFPVETGSWIVDTEITVPEDAEPGVYSLEATLGTKGVMIQDRINFTVQR
jgi:hypothetical protein